MSLVFFVFLFCCHYRYKATNFFGLWPVLVACRYYFCFCNCLNVKLCFYRQIKFFFFHFLREPTIFRHPLKNTRRFAIVLDSSVEEHNTDQPTAMTVFGVFTEHVSLFVVDVTTHINDKLPGV
jgi:hypothetical protein